MYGADDFGPAFQRVLVRACLDDHGLRGVVRRFHDARQLAFTDPASAWAWGLIRDNDRLSLLGLETEARRIGPEDPARAGVQAILTAEDARDSEYVSGRVIEWARQQLFATAFEEARQAWNAGRFDQAFSSMMTRIDEINDLRLDQADRGWFFEEFDERQVRRIRVSTGEDTFPCGVDPIDQRMHGGLSVGELGVVIAYSKIGKSFFLNQVGFIGARLRQPVAHYVLEGGRALCEDRYEARFAATVYREVKRGNLSIDTLRIARREYDILRSNLMIRGFADRRDWEVTPDDLVADLAALRRERGWVPRLVVVDYGDLLLSPGHSEQERQKTSFRRLKTLSGRSEGRGHRGYAVWTASQAVRPDRGADEREHVVKPRDVADCYEKVRVADALLSLNRTNQEKLDNIIRVYLGNYRDAEDNLLVKVQSDYEHGALTVLGAPPLPMATPAPGAT